MDRLGGARNRIATALAFALAALCFLLPFVTAGCDERATAQGIDFVTGDRPPTYDEDGNVVEPSGDDEDVAEVLIREGAPTATLALAFVLGAAMLSLLPGVMSAAACLLSGAFALGAFSLFLLGLELRTEGAFGDLRVGFWLAVLLTAAGTALARRQWAAVTAPLPEPRLGARLLAGGALLSILAVIVPHVAVGTGDGEDTTPLAYVFLWALSPGIRGTAAWTAIALVCLAFLVALSARVLSRAPTPASPAAAGGALGLAGLLFAVGSIAYMAALDGTGVGDGLWIQLAGAVLALAGGLVAARGSGEERTTVPMPARVLAALGALVVVAGTVVPYDRGMDDVPSRALLGLDTDLDRWFALAPFGLAIAALAAALLLSRPQACGALLGLGAGLGIMFLPLLYQAFSGEEDTPAGTLGAGGFVGLAGAALVVLAGVLARPPRTESEQPPTGTQASMQ